MVRSLVPLAALLALTLLPRTHEAQAPGKDKEKAKPKAVGIPGYKKQVIQGFTLLIHESVYENNDDPRWKRKPLDVLDLELGTIVRVLPEKPVKALQRLLVWIEWEDTSDPDLAQGVVAKYYGVVGNLGMWSLAQNKHALKANNVEVINMKSLTREHQPGTKFERCVLLHEMAHAVHHQVLDIRNQVVRRTYRQAMERGLYDEAKDVYGRTLRPPYAAKNEHEYFAEMTCAYLDKLHYFPFNADDLKSHDPAAYRLMEQTWGTRKQIETALKARSEKEASRKLEQARVQYTLDRLEQGMATLTLLINDFPDTKAAGTAKGWLERWKAEQQKKAPKKAAAGE
ncbi:MAG: hypothetical protein U0840_23415 [Gemmataceae bacterium]